MKKFFILLLSIFLASCWTSDDGLTSYSGSWFSLGIPKKWEIITKKELLPKPNVWVLELATTSKQNNNGFTNSLTVISENLKKTVSSQQYAISNNISQASSYVSYFQRASRKIKLSNNDITNVYIFDAKYNTRTPETRFVQTGIVCNKKWYLLTLAIPMNISDTKKYEYIFSTFSCK